MARNLGGRGMMLLGVATLSAASGCAREPEEPKEATASNVREALTSAEATAAIQRKLEKLGGAPVVGSATSPLALTPGGAAYFQRFTNGVLVYSDDAGAVYVKAVAFDKWLALQTQTTGTGENLFTFLGLPQSDTATTSNVSRTTFDRGVIVVDASNTARVVYGAIYSRYALLSATLGLPTNEEAGEAGGGRFQTFENGQLHFRADLTQAFMVSGAVLTRWQTLGGVSGVLGYPVGDVQAVGGNAPADSRSGPFEHGTIYYTTATGAHELLQGPLLAKYVNNYGGPTGWLGFPVGNESTAASGDHFVDFQGGVLVNHATADAHAGVYAFGTLSFWYDHASSDGGDCWLCGSVDLYTNLTVTAGSQTVVNGEQIGDGASGFNVQRGWAIGPAKSSVVVNVNLTGRDADDWPNPDDQLGAITATYSIDNLWGQLESFDHTNGNFDANFTIKNEQPFDESDFRGQMFWSYQNFKTDDLSYDQYAQAFTDVDPDETWWHPLNKLYYKWVFRDAGENGNCYGMSLESAYAQDGRSPYSEPISQYFADTQDGKKLIDAAQDAPHLSMLNNINVRHGYQFGLNQVTWFLAAFVSGITHDPVVNYWGSRALNDLGEHSLLMIYDDYIFGSGHVVRPYAWGDSGSSCTFGDPLPCFRIKIADPNHPKAKFPAEDYIEIDPLANYYRYPNNSKYSGGILSGGRMYFTPARLVLHDQVTPMAALFNPLEMIDSGLMVVLGNSGEMEQVTDAGGRTLFEPGVTAGKKWTDLRQDPAARIPNFAPIPFSTEGVAKAQIYAGRAMTGQTQTYDTRLAAGATAGTPYEMGLSTGKLSSFFAIPGTPGKAEHIVAEKIATNDKAISLTIPSDSNAKSLTWTVMGQDKYRWAEFSSFKFAPSQNIKMRVANAGYRVLVTNNGPATTAVLRVSGGRHAPPVTVGTIAIPSGDSSVEYELPSTDISLAGVVNGKNGWVVAPVTVTLSAKDYSGKGIQSIEYGKDQSTWQTYSGPFSYADQGTTLLYYRAQDGEQNRSLVKSQPFKIDSVLPNTTAAVSTTAGVKLTYSATDASPGSGIAGVHIVSQSAGGPVETFNSNASGTVSLATSCSAVELWAEDVAGNLQTPHLAIKDSVPPKFTAVPTITTTHCTAAAGLALAVTATDDCGVAGLTSNAPAQFPLGTTTVTWTAKDAAGNTTTATQQVTTELGDDPSCCPSGSNVIMGTLGNDTLNGSSGADCILGLGGQDTINGLGGNDALSGGNGDDIISGGDGSDWLAGGTGQDTLRGDAGNDICNGNDGVDWIYGGIGNDRLSGGQGTDHLMCEAGDDYADGGIDDDDINGGIGNDYLIGGLNHDRLNGGGGTDSCVRDVEDTITVCTLVNP
jgi:Ca2+-binding RTX toxin-like protein/uncharacterized protein with LGFP repeats